jgi:hypothetical protein
MPSSPIESRIATVFIFNYPYEKNVEKLERLYADRFSHRFYAMPFYEGKAPNVFPVYGNCFQFQSFFADAWDRLRDGGFTHFLFTADDLLINPALNERNLLSELNMPAGSAYVRGLDPVDNVRFSWNFKWPTLLHFHGKAGVDWRRTLPPPADAAAAMAENGVKFGRFGWHNFRGGRMTLKDIYTFLFYCALRLKEKRDYPEIDLLAPPYPLVVSYADFLIVPVEIMERFTRLCRIFAALDTFVEVAAPTALAMTCPRVVLESASRWHTFDLRGDGREEAAFGAKYDYEVSKVYANFPENALFIHPIKFSQWRF